MSDLPIIGAVRVSHHYVSTVVDLPVEHAAVALERHVRSARRLGQPWGLPLPREAPHGTAYWPRLTVLGRRELLGRMHDVELEVWPWDGARAEVGLRPVAGSRTRLPEREAWVTVASQVLADVVVGMARARSRGCHPAGRVRDVPDDQTVGQLGTNPV